MVLAVAAWAVAACADDTTNCHDEECVPHGGHGGSATGGGQGNGEGGTVLAKAYCDCMLVSCHDAYHETFGPDTDEPAARAACLSEASRLPEAGMDVDTGDFIECRIHHCELGRTDEAACPDTVGGVCAE